MLRKALSAGNISFPADKIKIFDIEIAPNYVLVKIYSYQSKTWSVFEMVDNVGNLAEIKTVITKYTILVGYNSLNYDDKIIIYLFYTDFQATNQDLYDLSQTIVQTKPFEKPIPPARFKFKFMSFTSETKYSRFWENSIDLIIFTKNKTLKECGVALDHLLIEDIVFDPNEPININQIPSIRKYCQNDVEITIKLFEYFKEEILMRFYMDNAFNEIAKKVGYYSSFLTKANPAIAQDLMAILYCCKKGIKFKQFRWQIQVPKSNKILGKDLILPGIKFKTKKFQQLLEKFQNLEIELENFEINSFDGDIQTFKPPGSSGFKETLDVDGMTLSVGLGGIHSNNSFECYKANENEDIVDDDVASYYPSLMINQSLKPDYLDNDWIEIYKNLRDLRVELKGSKNQTEKIFALALKIVLNSIFGKFNSPFFYAYAPEIAYSITVNGQLLLLKLIEELSINGFKIIYANTDGITLIRPKDKIELYQSIVKNWQKEYNLELEETLFKFVAYESVNHYFAVKSDDSIKYIGDYKTDNIYGTLRGRIIRKAVRKFLQEGISPEEILNNSKVPLDFCFSRKIGRNFKGYLGKTQVQKVNRYIPAKKEVGEHLYYEKEDGSKHQIPNGECVILANDLTSDFDMESVDKKFFERKIDELLTKFALKAKAVEFLDKNLNNVEKLRAKGLVPLPKNFKSNVIGTKRSQARTDWDFTKHPTIGVYTGAKLGVLCIDIDSFGKVPKDIVNIILDSETLMSWTQFIGSNQPLQLEKSPRFKAFFSFSGKQLGAVSLLKYYGFEVIYGGIANISGAYDCYDKEYVFNGELKPLPKELENRIKILTDRHKTKEVLDIDKSEKNDETALEYQPEIYQKVISEFLNKHCLTSKEELIPDGLKDIVHGQSEHIYVTKCPYRHEHTNPGDNMEIYITKQGLLKLHCWHQSCQTNLSKLQKDLNDKLTDSVKPKTRQELIKQALKANLGREAIAKLYE